MTKNNLITLQVRRKQSKQNVRWIYSCLFPEINSQRLDFRFRMSYLYRVNDKVVSIKLHAKEGIAILSFLLSIREKPLPAPAFLFA